jgi:hypothetical protein
MDDKVGEGIQLTGAEDLVGKGGLLLDIFSNSLSIVAIKAGVTSWTKEAISISGEA